MHRKILTISLAAVLIAAVVIAKNGFDQYSSWNDPVSQWATIKFSHKYHISEFETECSVCHAAADTSVSSFDSLLPAKAVCADCHEVESEDNCGLCHTDLENFEPYAVAQRDILFNHKLHVQQNEMECAACHAGIENSEVPSVAYLPDMASCYECHNDVIASNACESCHTNVEIVLPVSHREPDWSEQHKRLVRSAAPSNDCAVCHTDNFCQTCHAEANIQLTKGDFARSVSENRPAPSGKNPLVKQNVHDLNFIFTHGIELRSKQADCASCHNQQTFCADCHARNQDAGFASPVPLTHRSMDFVRVGVGSGGGLHAQLARKEIESCAACHDMQGNDPSCITCHVDRLPGRGNDPSTHPPNFLSKFQSERGDWHADEGSTCYNCHTNTRQAGIGFCGYCHGLQ